MQLDVDMSPPANDITFKVNLTNLVTHVTFDPDPCRDETDPTLS